MNHKQLLRRIRLQAEELTHPASHLPSLDRNNVVLLDTSLQSENCGDYIIMHYANMQLSKILQGKSFTHISTHRYGPEVEHAPKNYMKIACGTNLLSWDYEQDHSLATPKYHLGNYAHTVCLLAVGMREVKKEMNDFTPYTARFLRLLLDPRVLHSVRDEHTKQRLASIGVTNVLNTACVTMWNLTPEHCSRISRDRHDEVITTITEYARDPQQDKYMIETLLQKYARVHLWIQSTDDDPYLRSLNITSNRLHRIGHSFEEFDTFVKTNKESVDYFGTRLHAGVHCLNHGIRSMIVGVDNRASDIARDTKLPVIERNRLNGFLEQWIDRCEPIEIQLPFDNINRWKAQFSD